MDKLLVSSAPFKKQASYVYIPSLLWILALVPVLVAGIIFSGENSIYTFLLAFGSYVTLEIFYIIATKQPFFINILKAFPTAMIIGMLLPPNVAIQIPILCAVLSFFVKVFFGDDNGIQYLCMPHTTIIPTKTLLSFPVCGETERTLSSI